MDSRQIHILVNTTNVLVKVLTNGGEFPSIDSNHTKIINLLDRSMVSVIQIGKPEAGRTFPSRLRSKRVSATTFEEC